MSSRLRTIPVAVGVALAVVAVCVAGLCSEYRVIRSQVPTSSELQLVVGELESCEMELNGLLGPMNLLHGAWEGPPSYLLKLQGVNTQFRTQVFDCGMGIGDTASAATRLGAINLHAQRHPVETVPGEAPIQNAYGLTINGVVMRTPAEDLADHRRAHDLIAPLNMAGLSLLALLLPGMLIRALRGQVWSDNETARAPRDSERRASNSENPASE